VARIVALSSLVARGHVGLRALIPALESFGHDVIALPTVVLSNHAAHPHVARTLISPDVLDAMAQAIEARRLAWGSRWNHHGLLTRRGQCFFLLRRSSAASAPLTLRTLRL